MVCRDRWRTRRKSCHRDLPAPRQWRGCGSVGASVFAGMERRDKTMTQAMGVMIAAVLVLFNTAAAMSEPPSVSATLVTVHLFSVREMQKITMAPIGGNAWMRTCAKCSRQPATTLIQLENGGRGIKL